MKPDDLAVMANPREWPRWPILPIKNDRGRGPGEFPRLGFLVELNGPGSSKPDVRFVEGNIYLIQPGDIEKAGPADAAKLVGEGWVVD